MHGGMYVIWEIQSGEAPINAEIPAIILLEPLHDRVVGVVVGS